MSVLMIKIKPTSHPIQLDATAATATIRKTFGALETLEMVVVIGTTDLRIRT